MIFRTVGACIGPTEEEFAVTCKDWAIAGLMLLCVAALAGCAFLLMQQGTCV